MTRTTLIIAGVLVGATFLCVHFYTGKQKAEKDFFYLKQTKESVNIKRIKIPVKQVVVIEKEKLRLPEEVKRDVNKQVTATGQVPPYEGVTDVNAILDTQDGSTRLLAEQRPLPFADFLNERELGFRIGPESTGRWGADVHYRYSLGRVGKARVALYGEIAATARPSDIGKAKDEIVGKLKLEVYTR